MDQKYRHVHLVLESQTYLVPVTCEVESSKNPLRLRFDFNQQASPSDIEFIRVTFNGENIEMVTSRENIIIKGSIFNQLEPWAKEIANKFKS